MTQVSRKGFRDKNGKQVAIVPNVPGATAGNLASLDADGNLQDSGYSASDFAPDDHNHDNDYAPKTHSHEQIEKDESGVGGSIEIVANQAHEGEVRITLHDDAATPNVEEATIDMQNIANLNRALRDPSSTPENNSNKLITSKAVYDALQEAEGLTVDSDFSLTSTNPVQNKKVYEALLGRMGALKEIFINCDDSGSADDWEIKPDAAGEAAFRAALTWGNNAPRLVIVNIMKGTDGTTNHKTYRTIGSIHATAVEVNTDSYDLTAEIYVDGHVFTRTGEENNQEETWEQGLTLASNDIFTHTSNL